MSRVQQIEQELAQLSPEELREIHGLLEEMLEDGLKFTEEFEAAIQQSEHEMAAGQRPRLRNTTPHS